MDDAKSIIETVERLGDMEIISAETLKSAPADLALAILPEGKELHNLQPHFDALRDAPRRIETTAAVTTVLSFVDYINRFKTADTAVFATDDPSSPSIQAVVDFHGQGPSASPRFCKHRARYDFPVSDQIKAWSVISGKAMSHADLATFLQERQYDIANPPLDWMGVDPKTLGLILSLLNLADDTGEIDDGAADLEPADNDDRYIPRSAVYKLRKIRFGSAARLIQMARTVEIGVNAKAVEGYQPKTGERTIHFTEEHDTRDGAGRKIVVPDMFLLRAPIFEGETPQLIPVRLQYRRGSSAIAWFATLVEWKRVVRYAVKAEVDRVHDATSVPVFYGKP